MAAVDGRERTAIRKRGRTASCAAAGKIRSSSKFHWPTTAMVRRPFVVLLILILGAAAKDKEDHEHHQYRRDLITINTTTNTTNTTTNTTATSDTNRNNIFSNTSTSTTSSNPTSENSTDASTPPPATTNTNTPSSATLPTVYELLGQQTPYFQSLLPAEWASFLNDTSNDQTWTVLAPLDSALRSDVVLQSYLRNTTIWQRHMEYYLGSMFLPGAFSSQYLLTVDQEQQPLPTMTNTTFLTIPPSGWSFVSADVPASNGVVHVLAQVVQPDFVQQTLWDVIVNGVSNGGGNPVTAVVHPRYAALVRNDNRNAMLQQLQPTGTSVAAPSVAAPSSDTWDGHHVAYSIITENIDSEMLSDQPFQMLSTWHNQNEATLGSSGTNLLLTYDEESSPTARPLRFNNVTWWNAHPILAVNGMVYIMDEMLEPPTVAQLLDYSTRYTTNHKYTTTLELVQAAARDSDHNHTSTTTSSSTWLAVASDFGPESPQAAEWRTTNQLVLSWQGHVDYLLQHNMLDTAYTWTELVNLATSQQQVTMRSGVTLPLETTASNQHLLLGGRALLPTMGWRGIDGIVHEIETMLVPPSMQSSVVELLQQDPTLSSMYTAIQDLQLQPLFSAAPITLLAVPNDQTNAPQQLFNQAFVNNLVLQDVLYYNELQQRNGQSIATVGGQSWTVEVESGDPQALRLKNPQFPPGYTMATLVASEERLGRDGVLQVVSFGVESSPSNNSTTFCNTCEGAYNENAVAFQGEPCQEWIADANRIVMAGSEQCLLSRVAGVVVCGCPEVTSQRCHLCDGTMLDSATDDPSTLAIDAEKKLPDAVGITCQDVALAPAMDGQQTCSLLQQKYASWCGCTEAQAPSCNLCDEPDQVFQDKAYPFQQTAELDLSCAGMETLLNAQTAESCPSFRQIMEASVPVSMQAYCECPGYPPPQVCGGALCPAGQHVPLLQKEMNPPGQSFTCSELDLILNYTESTRFCESAPAMRSACCQPISSGSITRAPSIAQISTVAPSAAPTNASQLVEIATTFMVYSIPGTESGNLTDSRNGVTLKLAWANFVDSLVASMDSKVQDGRRLRPRRLVASLASNSADVYAVFGRECTSSEIPSNAVCQEAYSKYNLEVLDEEPEDVQNEYVAATNKAIDQGALQESIIELDPNFSWMVLASTGAPTKAGDEGLPPWAIVLISVAGGMFLYWCWIMTAIVSVLFTSHHRTIDDKTEEALLQENGSEKASSNAGNSVAEEDFSDEDEEVSIDDDDETDDFPLNFLEDHEFWDDDDKNNKPAITGGWIEDDITSTIANSLAPSDSGDEMEIGRMGTTSLSEDEDDPFDDEAIGID